MSMFDLAAYCLQLEMIRGRLLDQLPLDNEPWSAAERQQYSRACGFLNAARTSMMRLMEAHNNRLDDETAKRPRRRGSKLQR